MSEPPKSPKKSAMNGVRKLFDAFDKKRDGTINIDDMALFCDCLGVKLNNDQLIQLLILSKADYHYYSWEQCMNFVQKIQDFQQKLQKKAEEEAKEAAAYKAFCEKGDFDRGVSFEEFQHVSRRVSAESNELENEEIFRKYDEDCDGYLNKEEFDRIYHDKESKPLFRSSF